MDVTNNELFPTSSSSSSSSSAFSTYYNRSNVPLLYRLIMYKQYRDAITRLNIHPEEASIWMSHSGMKRLPIHDACLLIKPSIPTINPLILTLIDAYPLGLRYPDENGRLPLHIAAWKGAHVDILTRMMREYTEALRVRDDNDRTPLEYSQLSSNANVVEMLELRKDDDDDRVFLPQQQQQRRQQQLNEETNQDVSTTSASDSVATIDPYFDDRNILGSMRSSSSCSDDDDEEDEEYHHPMNISDKTLPLFPKSPPPPPQQRRYHPQSSSTSHSASIPTTSSTSTSKLQPISNRNKKMEKIILERTLSSLLEIQRVGKLVSSLKLSSSNHRNQIFEKEEEEEDTLFDVDEFTETRNTDPMYEESWNEIIPTETTHDQLNTVSYSHPDPLSTDCNSSSIKSSFNDTRCENDNISSNLQTTKPQIEVTTHPNTKYQTTSNTNPTTKKPSTPKPPSIKTSTSTHNQSIQNNDTKSNNSIHQTPSSSHTPPPSYKMLQEENKQLQHQIKTLQQQNQNYQNEIEELEIVIQTLEIGCSMQFTETTQSSIHNTPQQQLNEIIQNSHSTKTTTPISENANNNYEAILQALASQSKYATQKCLAKQILHLHSRYSQLVAKTFKEKQDHETKLKLLREENLELYNHLNQSGITTNTQTIQQDLEKWIDDDVDGTTMPVPIVTPTAAAAAAAAAAAGGSESLKLDDVGGLEDETEEILKCAAFFYRNE